MAGSGSGKKRPGQNYVKNAGKAAADMQKRAQDEYDSVDSSASPDLKSLINGVKSAQGKKDQQQKRLSKKQLQNQKKTLDAEYAAAKKKEALADAAAKVDEEIQKEELELIEAEKRDLDVKRKDIPKKKAKQKAVSKLNDLLTNLGDAIDRKNANLQAVLPKDVLKLKTAFTEAFAAWQKAKSKANDPDKDQLAAAEKQGSIDEMMKAFKKSIDFLDQVSKRNQKRMDAQKELQGKQHQSLDLKNLDYSKIYESRLSKFLNLGKDKEGNISLSKSMKTAASIFGRSLKDKASNLAPSALYNNGVQWALSKAGNNKGAVSAIMAVDKSIRVLGSTVKGVGSASMEWLQKGMSSMFGFLKKRWGQLGSGSSEAGSLGKLVGWAALLSSLILPLLKGINKELSDRFGPDYVSKFLTGMWATAKDWIVKSIKEFLFGSDKAKSSETPQAKKDISAYSEAPSNTKANKEFGSGFFGRQASLAKNSLLNDDRQSEVLLNNALDDYNRATDPVVKLKARNYVEMVIATKPNLVVGYGTYQALKKSGFNAPSITHRNIIPIGGPAQVPKSGAVSVPGTTSPGAISVGAPIASKPSSAVVTMPPPKQGSDTTSIKPGGKSAPTAGALGASQIPNQGVGDGIGAFNAGLLAGQH